MELSEETRRKLVRTPVSAITTVLSRLGYQRATMQDVMPVRKDGSKMVGPAFTVRYIPSREDIDDAAAFGTPGHLQRRAIEECPPGNVLVIDARGDARAACGGDMLALRLQVRGVAGLVTDGGLRDADTIGELGFPAFFQRPAAPPTFIVHHPADINVPIGCGRVPVYPGDIVVGDSDGVVVIPRAKVDEVADAAIAIVEYDEFVEAELRAGRTLYDVYPATDASRARYAEWRKTRGG